MPEEITLEKPLAVVGEEDAVLGFKALGFKVYAVKEKQEFKSTLEEVVRQKNALCLVQDNIYRATEDFINNYKNLPLPIFIPFSKSGWTDLLDNIARDIRIRATGAL